MSALIFKIIYLAGLVVQIAIRAPFARQRRQNKIVTTQPNRQEVVLLLLLFLGNFILPVVYIFTPWLNFADYTLPAWAGWLGVVILVGALIVFWRAHVDLGQNWSPTLQIREGHSLITNSEKMLDRKRWKEGISSRFHIGRPLRIRFRGIRYQAGCARVYAPTSFTCNG